MSSMDLFLALHKLDLIESDRYPHWWRNYGSWWILPEAVLTQQTKWENVEKSVANLKQLGLDSMEKLANAEAWMVAQAITPAGFYNQKTARILSLAKNIVDEFENFENFCESVDREWLLNQKGIGFESADAILCYGCKKEVMVVDSYTHKLLTALGYEFEDYHEIQSWLENGIESEFDESLGLDLNKTYAYFHGLIVEFNKQHRTKAGYNLEILDLPL